MFRMLSGGGNGSFSTSFLSDPRLVPRLSLSYAAYRVTQRPSGFVCGFINQLLTLKLAGYFATHIKARGGVR